MAFIKSVIAGFLVLAAAMLAKPILIRALQLNAGDGPNLPPSPDAAPRRTLQATAPDFDARSPARRAGPASRQNPEDLLDAVIDVRRIEGKVSAASSKKLAELLRRHPDLAAQAMRRWLAQRSDSR